jgi:hypothetical protein
MPRKLTQERMVGETRDPALLWGWAETYKLIDEKPATAQKTCFHHLINCTVDQLNQFCPPSCAAPTLDGAKPKRPTESKRSPSAPHRLRRPLLALRATDPPAASCMPPGPASAPHSPGSDLSMIGVRVRVRARDRDRIRVS